MDTDAPDATLSDRLTTTDRLLDEGTLPLLAAAKAAGMRPVPCLRTLMRAAITRKLEALKMRGRWATSAAAIRRWIARQQRGAGPTPPPLAHPDAVLSRYGLGRGQGEGAAT